MSVEIKGEIPIGPRDCRERGGNKIANTWVTRRMLTTFLVPPLVANFSEGMMN